MPITIHIGLHPDRPIAETADIVVEAERLGYDGAWIADSQNLFRDAFTALALSADRTSTIALGTGVTNPVTRHASVIAGAIATVDELSDGRMTLGIGTGETAVQTIGKRPARLADMEHTVNVVRGLLDGERPVLDDFAMSMPWPRRAVPIHIAATGPRALALAGRAADGAYLKVGTHPSLVRYAIDAAHGAAIEARRDLSGYAVHTLVPFAVSKDEETARATVAGFAAAIAGAALAAVPRDVVPEDLWRDMEELNAASREARAEQSYVEWLDSPAYRELITDTIVDAFSIAGTPSQVLERLDELEDLGVTGVVIPLVMSDPRPQLTAIGDVVAALAAR
jgi:5,10-methylenetetrahydromethanopterin reductase